MIQAKMMESSWLLLAFAWGHFKLSKPGVAMLGER